MHERTVFSLSKFDHTSHLSQSQHNVDGPISSVCNKAL
jgi:hypothetical protein